MLELLKERVSTYTYEKARKFRKAMGEVNPKLLAPHLPVSTWNFPEDSWGFMIWIMVFHNKNKDPLPMWERLNDGYLIYTVDTAVFFGDNSHIYKLSRTHLMHDWLMHVELYEITSKHNDIQIEIPIHGEHINLLDSDYWYTEVIRPNHNTLTDPHQMHHENKLDATLMCKLIDESTIHMRYVEQVYKKHLLGCPELGANMIKFKIDNTEPLSGIWTDIKHWNKSFDQYVAQTYANYYHYLDDHRNKDLILHHEVRPILNYMIDKFKQFNVPIETIKMVEYDLDNIQVCDQGSKPKNYYD